MRRLRRCRRDGLVLACVAISAIACGGSDPGQPPAALSPSANAALHVDTHHVVVVTADGEAKQLDDHGRETASLGQVPLPVGGEVNAISVSPDGQVLVSTLNDHDEACRAVVYRATTDGFEKYVDGAAAVFSEDGTQLAYVRYASVGEFCPRTQLVIRRVADGAEQRIDYPGERQPEGTPPAWPISWSPDGTKLALMTSDGLGVITIRDKDVRQVGGGLPAAPAFLDDTTVAAMSGCCVGPLRVAAYPITSERPHELFQVPGPVRSIQRDRGGDGLWLTVEEASLWHWDGAKLERVAADALVTSG